MRDSIAGVNNVIGRPIYLPALDMEQAVTIDPATDTVVSAILTEDEPPAEVMVKAGTLLDHDGDPYTGQLGITEVPATCCEAHLHLASSGSLRTHLDS